MQSRYIPRDTIRQCGRRTAPAATGSQFSSLTASKAGICSRLPSFRIVLIRSLRKLVTQYKLYQGVLYFQNVTLFHSTRVNGISFAPRHKYSLLCAALHEKHKGTKPAPLVPNFTKNRPRNRKGTDRDSLTLHACP